MPWQETQPVLERHHFAQDLDSGQWSMTELCLRYGISRNTGYKWLDRYRQSGPRGPPAANLNTQQRVFNAFQATYNELRPHEALDDDTPASRWGPSPRAYPERIVPPEYPGHFEVRRVSSPGTFRLHSGQHFLSQALNHEYIGLEEVHDGLWNLLYYETLLGRLSEHTHTITGAPSLRGKC